MNLYNSDTIFGLMAFGIGVSKFGGDAEAIIIGGCLTILGAATMAIGMSRW